jgi:hypothetical protein
LADHIKDQTALMKRWTLAKTVLEGKKLNQVLRLTFRARSQMAVSFRGRAQGTMEKKRGDMHTGVTA